MKLDFDSAAPPEQAWRRKLNSHATILKEFSVTFMEAIKLVSILYLSKPIGRPEVHIDSVYHNLCIILLQF